MITVGVYIDILLHIDLHTIHCEMINRVLPA